MRIKKITSEKPIGDLTPMIDMVFQLIAFFMVLVNFSEADNDQRIQLPQSVLAKPPEGLIDDAIFINMKTDGGVIYSGEELTIEQLKPYLQRERQVLALNNKTAGDATIIIRADGAAPTGKVQELIQACQELEYEKFALRAKEEIEGF